LTPDLLTRTIGFVLTFSPLELFFYLMGSIALASTLPFLYRALLVARDRYRDRQAAKHDVNRNLGRICCLLEEQDRHHVSGRASILKEMNTITVSVNELKQIVNILTTIARTEMEAIVSIQARMNKLPGFDASFHKMISDISESVQSQVDLMKEPAEDTSSQVCELLIAVRDAVKESIEANSAIATENARLVRNILEQNKRMMVGVFGTEAGGSVEDDDKISHAKRLMEEHPGLKLVDALQRIEELSQYR
jgi:hypothetical protein